MAHIIRMTQLPEVGRRVRLTQQVDRFPHFWVPVGATGTIAEVTDGLVSVKLDAPVAGAEEYDNCLHFYDAAAVGRLGSDGWDDFAGQVEYLD